jgi:hypothetical protein
MVSSKSDAGLYFSRLTLSCSARTFVMAG